MENFAHFLSLFVKDLWWPPSWELGANALHTGEVRADFSLQLCISMDNFGGPPTEDHQSSVLSEASCHGQSHDHSALYPFPALSPWGPSFSAVKVDHVVHEQSARAWPSLPPPQPCFTVLTTCGWLVRLHCLGCWRHPCLWNPLLSPCPPMFALSLVASCCLLWGLLWPHCSFSEWCDDPHLMSSVPKTWDVSPRRAAPPLAFRCVCLTCGGPIIADNSMEES